MAILRNGVSDYVLREGVSSSSGVPEFVPDEGRRFKATDIRCEDCGAAEGDRCEGAGFCLLRMRAATELARAGQLDSHGPARVLSECEDCHRQMNPGGRFFSCANTAHQCRKRRGDGKQCQYAVQPGSLYCPAHAAQELGRRPGRKPLLSEEQVAEAMRRYDAGGETWVGIAQSMRVSDTNLQARVKMLRARLA